MSTRRYDVIIIIKESEGDQKEERLPLCKKVQNQVCVFLKRIKMQIWVQKVVE
jgi:hypothetical protein